MKNLTANLCAVLCLFFITIPMEALDIPLTIKNRESTAKPNEPITCGIPFAEGALLNTSKIRILQNNTEIPAQFKTAALWPDGSIRWLHANFQVDLPASGTASVTAQTGSSPTSFSGITLDNQSNQLTIHTGTADFTFNKNQFSIFGQSFEVVSSGTTYTAVPKPSNWTVEESGAIKTIIKVEGEFYNGSTLFKNSLVGFRARLFFFRNKSGIRAQLTFRNNNSFGWNYQTPGPIATLSGARLGTALLASGGSYVFGQGVEKTWNLEISDSGSVTVRESRYNANGSLKSGYKPPYPVGIASPSYYSSTQAWGQITPPLSGFESSFQADLDLFEKLQRAKTIFSDVENPPGLTGKTVFGHLYQDINSWNDYGDLRWGGSYGSLSGNHYDWPFGMLLQFLRTGKLEFFDAAHVFTRHEIDFDIYHTNENGTAYNYQKQWESRPSHETADNVFGPGRPSHTWCQGYALYWLLTGDPRGYDGYTELMEGIRQYVYESFNNEGYIDTNELRIAGWLVDNLMVLWRIEPAHVFSTSYGNKTIRQAIKDIFKSVFDLEAAAGKNGYVYAENPPDPTLRQPLMNCYFLEPAIKAYSEVFKNRDASYASGLLGLIRRMTTWLISITYGGDTNSQGHYRPRQIPYMVDTDLAQQTDGQIPYVLMTANAAGFCFMETGEQSYTDYMRPAFRDYIRYLGVDAGDRYIEDPTQRTPTAYNSSVYTDTESKVHGWSSRFGQYYLAAEASSQSSTLRVTSPNGGENWVGNSSHSITWISTGGLFYKTAPSTPGKFFINKKFGEGPGNTFSKGFPGAGVSAVKIAYSTDNGAHYNTVTAGTSNSGSFTWTVPNTPSTQCRIKINDASNSSVFDVSDSVFTISAPVTSTITLNRSRLNFGAVLGSGGAVTPVQTVTLGIGGNTALNWSAASSAAWVVVSPTSGSGPGLLQASVNPTGINPGTYTGAITVTAPGASNSPQTVQVVLTVYSQGASPFGSFDSPADHADVTGSIAVTGWALDDVEISQVQIWREPVTGEGVNLVYIGDAVMVDGARPDVEQAYPGYPFNYRAGWGYMLLTYGLPHQGMNDTFTLHVIALDVEGNSRELGDRTIHCHNEDGVNPFGAIDTPAQGGTASGKQYINFGWALTPPPSVIPTNGSTIGVYIDGQYKGHVVYNQWRPEIKTLFPSYLNNDGAGGYFVLDTTGYGDGLHTIGWAVQDNGGHVDGIGSRFFTIYNHAAGAYNPGAGLKTLGVTGLSVNRDGISVLKGFDRIAGVEWVYPNESGDCIIGVAPLERLEIDLNAGEFRCCSGYMEVGEEWRALPAGSVLDKEIGIFYWQVSPGFWGKYGLVFVGEKEYKTVQVWVEKRGQDRKGG